MVRLPSDPDPAMLPQVGEFFSARARAANDAARRAGQWYRAQLLARRVLLALAALACAAAGVLVLVFHRRVVGALVDVSNRLEHLRWGAAILFALVFMVGFPPLLGFSALLMLCGMVYGFPYGWPLLALASISGSLASFLVFRYVLRRQAELLVQKHENFRAFSEILREDASLFLLVLIRLCPLPYSLLNGALAAIPNLPAWTYFLASVITSPKMLIHVFVGHTIKNLGDAARPKHAKALDVLSIVITAGAVSLATYIIYNRMQKKLQLYHQNARTGPGYDELVFGNFDDDLESGANLELNSGDFDEDNFIIADDDPPSNASVDSPKRLSVADLGDMPLDDPLEPPLKAYRDY